jgi:transcription elongation factor Elf1
MLIKFNCKKCKKEHFFNPDIFEANKKHIATCIYCKDHTVFEWNIEMQTSQPDCLYGMEENCEVDDHGVCSECGKYFSNADRSSEGQDRYEAKQDALERGGE